MSIPDYQEFMLPLLKLLDGGRVITIGDARKELAAHFQLTDEEKARPLPSGRSTYLSNRVGWARTYLIYRGRIVAWRELQVQVIFKCFQVCFQLLHHTRGINP